MNTLKKYIGYLVLISIIIIGIWHCRLPDINTCSIDELTKIYMVGEKRAEIIISNRPYTNYNELYKYKEIGDKTIKRLILNTKIVKK